MWIIISILVVVVLCWLLTPTGISNSKPNESNSTMNIGMYNMNLHLKNKDMYSSTGEPFYLYASIFNEILGYAAQGRTKDINYVYKNDLAPLYYHSDFITLMNDLKPDILAMSKIGKRVSNANMPLNKNFESIGDFEDYMLHKSKSFMDYFNKLNAIDLKSLYDEKYSDRHKDI